MAQGKPIMYSRGDVSRLLPYRRISKEREWAPNTILASGLVFYYNDAFAANLFRQMHEVLEDGGLFLFDNIIGNPNKKLLSKICVTRSGTPWEFYYRRPEQIVPWLSKAGFAKVDYATDPWNMYVLYQARKTDKRQ